MTLIEQIIADIKEEIRIVMLVPYFVFERIETSPTSAKRNSASFLLIFC